MFFTPTIDGELANALKPTNLRTMVVASRTFPTFRFPDFHRAAHAFVAARKSLYEVHSSHYFTLDHIVRRQFGATEGAARKIKPSPTQLVAVDYRQEESFPVEAFWCFRDAAAGVDGIIRIKVNHNKNTDVDVAVSKPGAEADVLQELCDLSVTHSIYRNKLLQIDFGAEIRDEYGEVTSGRELQVTFRADPNVTADDIVMDPQVEPILERNVVRFHRMRKRLKSLGLPLQRGVLLHGPPGTGKTFTCQYLYHRLKPITMIVVAGKGLTEVKSICNLARTLQPSIVVLEDVDLIFSSREINLYSTGLGEMMDELDGFDSDDAVTFVLTTNAIDRLELAIKDRPGRISQCVYFGLPNEELRRRYLQRFLRPYNIEGLSIDRVARNSEGGSQAFLQELVNRAVQIAAEEEPDGDSDVHLTTAHFDEAIEEMTRFTEIATESIIGFQRKPL